MKKLFTLLFSFGIIGATFAQSHSGVYQGKSNGRDVYANDNRHHDDNYNRRELEIQKLRINREYDARIKAVRYSRRLRASEKSWQIRKLENERMEQIRIINARYSKSNRYDDRYDKGDRRKW